MHSAGRSGRRLVALIIVAMLASACGGDDATSDEETTPSDAEPAATSAEESEIPASEGDPDEAALAELIEAAEAQGSMILYSTATENVTSDLVDAFEATYDVSVEWIRMGGADGVQRFMAENEADSNVADVYLGGDIAFFDTVAEEGLMVGPADADIPGFPGDFPDRWIRDNAAVVQVQPWGFAVNTSILPDESDWPREWPDLLDPQYEDRILMSDPRGSSAYNDMLYVVLQEYGEEWFQDFTTQNVNYYESGVPAMEALGAGEGAVQVGAVAGLVAGAADRGAPVEMIVPSATTGVEMSIALPTAAPNPDAGRLFAHFLLSEEGNPSFNQPDNVFSVYDPALPESYQSPVPEAQEAKDQFLDLLNLS